MLQTYLLHPRLLGAPPLHSYSKQTYTLRIGNAVPKAFSHVSANLRWDFQILC